MKLSKLNDSVYFIGIIIITIIIFVLVVLNKIAV